MNTLVDMNLAGVEVTKTIHDEIYRGEKNDSRSEKVEVMYSQLFQTFTLHREIYAKVT